MLNEIVRFFWKQQIICNVEYYYEAQWGEQQIAKIDSKRWHIKDGTLSFRSKLIGYVWMQGWHAPFFLFFFFSFWLVWRKLRLAMDNAKITFFPFGWQIKVAFETSLFMATKKNNKFPIATTTKTETNKCEKFCKTNDDGRICHYKTIWERVSGKSAAAPVKRVPPHFCFFFQAENSKTYANIENDWQAIRLDINPWQCFCRFVGYAHKADEEDCVDLDLINVYSV